MIFTDGFGLGRRWLSAPLRPALLLVPLLLLLSLAAGCQFMPASEEAQTESASTQPATGPAQAASEPAAVERLPNPYLSDHPTVATAARQRFAAAIEALHKQQWQVAETDLLWLTENYPDLSGPYLNLALLYQHNGEDKKVEPAFLKAIAANANNIGAYNQYGIWLRGQGRFTDAEQQYLKALKKWPDSPESHLNLGILYDLYMGRLQPALDQYLAYQALQEKPDRQVQGWIVDTRRRLSESGAPESQSSEPGEGGGQS